MTKYMSNEKEIENDKTGNENTDCGNMLDLNQIVEDDARLKSLGLGFLKQ